MCPKKGNRTTKYYDLQNKLQYILSKFTSEKTKGTIKNEQSKDTSNIGYKTQDEIKVKENQRGNQE